ncbi:MAG: PilZ domain-containing protein [Myxococcales bacterium]|nr:PilZ domain-containing protein [Myxococcales bacterium]MCB9716322.1 PilZ domain-containing protein [Myxococcales bacterium]
MVEGPETPSERGRGETRQHFRSSRKLEWRVDFEPASVEGSAGRRHARTLGISLGGTFIVCDDPPPVDSDLHLWLHPDNPIPGQSGVLRLRAQVRWINGKAGELPRGFGVAFRALTAADEVALHSGFSRSMKKVV